MKSAPASPRRAESDRIAAFLRSRSGGSPETVKTYRRRLGRYVDWHESPTIDRDSYDSYIAHVRRQGRRQNGIALDSVVLLVFAEFLGIDTRGWQRVGWRETPVEWLRDTEFEALVRAAFESRHDGEDRAFALEFLRGTGLRLAEFLALRWRDCDLEAGRVTVRSGKGSRSRTIPLPDDGPPEMGRAIGSLREMFWRHHPDLALDEARRVADFVWPEREPWRMHNWLSSAAKRAGLPGVQTHPHILRHSFATSLAMRGVPAPVIQRLLGHASLGTTSRYTRAVGADVIDALRRVGAQSDASSGTKNSTAIRPNPA